MDAGARRLIGQIAVSMTAMNQLFDALLDVSQLDAGVVQARSADFAIQPLLERICRDYETEAARKGLRIVLRPCSLSVHTDAALLEQIVRNVLSNAVRYTDKGRVVVGCRRGPRLAVEVWDTGPGIAEEHQSIVFQEFFQVGNPERDRTKGLGLGLAITQRVAHLIDCPIRLTSTPGKGTRFTVWVSRAATAAPAVSETSGPAAPVSGGLVAVVDDEAAILQATQSLLSDWGYEVVAAGSGAELVERLQGRAPNLLVCDWRLRGEETAMSVVERLRARFTDPIPTLLITGDTAPERLREASETGLLLLHKPVPGGKLRAAIGNLIRAQASPIAIGAD
jgi:CheY-like chemotaxis protein/anti-sigma regulatory factor (Ser/Thr protein kinase)